MKVAEALHGYHRTHTPQVVSFTAPTGAGKTIIMASLAESIFFGSDSFEEQQNSIIIWLSDSPQLNEQSKQKIDAKADKIRLGQCVTVTDDSFDQEFFDDGHIYFLNTQKLSKISNLTQNDDSRTYTIWETIANTIREKSDHLYFIIDEAHRGAQGREASKATTIMQKFIKGSEEDGIPPMPVVIGMSATSKRFNSLVEGVSSTVHYSIVTADEVRASGLLKDRIAITYPEAGSENNDMAILQSAADDWKEKWDHWTQYCYEQHYAYVNPILVIQVQNKTAEGHTDTDLDDCLAKIEDRIGFKFDKCQVVHTFGDTNASIKVNGLDVEYVEPSRISDDRNIRVVFFKENLSTGWDCPRAETMMSFRHATDATYIAQLLGRMIRTPMQMHIQVDEVLNDVHLYLPYFDKDTVKDVVDELQNSEGGEIPTDIYGEPASNKKYVTLTARRKKKQKPVPGQVSLFPDLKTDLAEKLGAENTKPKAEDNPVNGTDDEAIGQEADKGFIGDNKQEVPSIGAMQITDSISEDNSAPGLENGYSYSFEPITQDSSEASANSGEETVLEDNFDREEVMKFINDAGLLTYDIRRVRVNDDYLKSLFEIAHLLTISGLRKESIREIQHEIVSRINDYIEDLKAKGEYEDLVTQVKQFKLATQIFDAFGETVDDFSIHELYTTTDADVDRQFRAADSKLHGEGIGNVYGNEYMDESNPNAFKIDVILFVVNDGCMLQLRNYAKERFHGLVDEYRRYILTVDSDKIRRSYDRIVSNGDTISKHNFRLPETIQVPKEDGGREYRNHLFVDDETGYAKMKLNSWEAGVIEEEASQDDFVCWIRNPSRGSWALSIPYKIEGIVKPAYPDFIIVRKDSVTDYVIDVLEPHSPDFKDNLGKAKGFAEYARQNQEVGRIQLIREVRDANGKKRYKRLDMSKSSICEKVLSANNNDELDHIFDIDGFFM